MIYSTTLLSFLLLLIACNTNGSKNMETADTSATIEMTNKEVKEENSADSNLIKISTDSILTIDLKASAGKGFSWQLNDSAYKKNLTYIGQTFENINPAVDGADGIQHFKFQPKETGTTKLEFIYVQPFVKPFPKNAPIKNFSIQIIHP